MCHVTWPHFLLNSTHACRGGRRLLHSLTSKPNIHQDESENHVTSRSFPRNVIVGKHGWMRGQTTSLQPVTIARQSGTSRGHARLHLMPWLQVTQRVSPTLCHPRHVTPVWRRLFADKKQPNQRNERNNNFLNSGKTKQPTTSSKTKEGGDEDRKVMTR